MLRSLLEQTALPSGGVAAPKSSLVSETTAAAPTTSHNVEWDSNALAHHHKTGFFVHPQQLPPPTDNVMDALAELKHTTGVKQIKKQVS